MSFESAGSSKLEDGRRRTSGAGAGIWPQEHPGKVSVPVFQFGVRLQQVHIFGFGSAWQCPMHPDSSSSPPSQLDSHLIVEIQSELHALQLLLDSLPRPHPRRPTFSGHQLLALTLPNGFQPRAIHSPSVWVLFFRLRKTLTKPLLSFFPRTKSTSPLVNSVCLTSRVVNWCLGLIHVSDCACSFLYPRVASEKQPPPRYYIFLTVITSATEVGDTRPTADFPESVAKIYEVKVYSLVSSVWDDLSVVGDNLPSLHLWCIMTNKSTA